MAVAVARRRRVAGIGTCSDLLPHAHGQAFVGDGTPGQKGSHLEAEHSTLSPGPRILPRFLSSRLQSHRLKSRLFQMVVASDGPNADSKFIFELIYCILNKRNKFFYLFRIVLNFNFKFKKFHIINNI